LIAGALLDVGDVAGRFDVVDRGEIRESHLTIYPGVSERRIEVRSDRRQEHKHREERAWLPAAYRLRVKLINKGNSWPPLFWKPYDQPVEAETTIRVKSDGSSSTT
jgi:hypothetical protein